MSWLANFLGWFRPAPKPLPYPSQVGFIEPFDAAQLLAGHNIERLSRRIPALAMSPDLCSRAEDRARNAALAGRTTEHLHDGFALVPGSGRTAENAALGQVDAPSVMAAWMRSEGHRDNILDPAFTAMGAGRWTARPEGITYWYVLFTGLRDEGWNGADDDGR